MVDALLSPISGKDDSHILERSASSFGDWKNHVLEQYTSLKANCSYVRNKLEEKPNKRILKLAADALRMQSNTRTAVFVTISGISIFDEFKEIVDLMQSGNLENILHQLPYVFFTTFKTSVFAFSILSENIGCAKKFSALIASGIGFYKVFQAVYNKEEYQEIFKKLFWASYNSAYLYVLFYSLAYISVALFATKAVMQAYKSYQTFDTYQQTQNNLDLIETIMRGIFISSFVLSAFEKVADSGNLSN